MPVKASEEPSSPPPAETLKLSPFEVRESNTGYLAPTAMSGTRLASNLEDLASSTTVVTKQQMLDFAAIDIHDVFLYEANTEGTATYTAATVGSIGEIVDSTQDNPAAANRVRGIGAANIARNNYASSSRIPLDAYNSAAVEISRGPNSSIFGLGSASGTVNVVGTTANVGRNSSQFTLRGDSFGGYRSSIDLNRALIKDRLAIRLLALYDSKAFLQKPSGDLTRRQEALITYRPFENTTIRASYESYFNFARRPNSVTPRDRVTDWLAAGSPTWDPTTATAYRNGVSLGTFTVAQDANLPAGLFSNGSGVYSFPSMYFDRGQLGLWTVNRTTTTSNPTTVNTNFRYIETGTENLRLRGTTKPLYTSAGVTDRSLYDWEKFNAIAPNFRRDRADVYNVELEHVFLNTPRHLLAAQLGWYREDSVSYNHNQMNGGVVTLAVDVNQKLLDGRPNPYFLRPYIGGTTLLTTWNRPELNEDFRGQLAYQLDLTKERNAWRFLGRHRMSGYVEDRRLYSYARRYQESVTSDHTWSGTTDRGSATWAGRILPRYYVGDNKGYNFDYGLPATFGIGGRSDFYWFNGVTQKWVTESASYGEVGYLAGTSDSQQKIHTRGAVLQSFLLDERIVGTVGWRNDSSRSRTSVAQAGPNGFTNFAALANYTPWIGLTGPTTTKGLVVRPFKGWRSSGSGLGALVGEALGSLNLFYNTSESFQPAPPRINLLGEQLSNPSGFGKDYGASIRLFKGKLVLRASRYDSVEIDSRTGDGNIAQRVTRIDFDPSGAFASDTFDLQDSATQWVAQLYPNLNAAQQRSEVYKIMKLPEGFIEQFKGNVGPAETNDVASRGWEFEVNFNPNQYATLKVTAAQQQTIDSHMSPNIQRRINERLPVWKSIINPLTGQSWWTTSGASNFYATSVDAPYKLRIANEGKPRSQVREWRWNALASYKLAGISDNRWLKQTSVGGAVRWEDKASIGFLGGTPEADGVVRSLDPNKPVYDPARTYCDFFVMHNLRLGNGKVRARVQLNVRNAFEGGRLQAIAVNPDGTPFAFRIVDPRQFILSTTFDL